MSKLRAIALLTGLLGGYQTQASNIEASVVVITNQSTPIEQLSRSEIKSLYLGAPLSIPLKAVMLPTNSAPRIKFTTHIMGLSESRLQSHFAQMRFSGRQAPIVEISEVNDVLNYVKQTPNVVAFVPAGVVFGESVKVLYTSR